LVVIPAPCLRQASRRESLLWSFHSFLEANPDREFFELVDCIFSLAETVNLSSRYFLFSDEKKVTKEKSPAAAKQLELFERSGRKNNSASPQTDFCFYECVLRVLFRLFCIGR